MKIKQKGKITCKLRKNHGTTTNNIGKYPQILKMV